MKKIITIMIVLVLIASTLAGCGEEQITLVDITTEQGISLKLPSDITKQSNVSYANTSTGDNAVFGVSEVEKGFALADWKQEDITALFKQKYKEVEIKSFENGKQINGNEALVANFKVKNDKDEERFGALVMLTNGVNNYNIHFLYRGDNANGSLAKNLQACIDSIKVEKTKEAQSSSQKSATTTYTKDSLEIKELEKKNIDLVKVYNEVAKLAIDNGWGADELTTKELNAANAIIGTFNSIIKDPPSANGADLPEMLKAVDELITELKGNMKQRVSAPYGNKK